VQELKQCYENKWNEINNKYPTMKQIEIKELRLLNFKGQKDLTVNFSNNTSIFGENATGKTTIFDAFTWLLFGKDSTNKKDFNIKTLDENNNEVHKIEHEVSGALIVNEAIITLKRIYKENWVKTRGALESELKGHKTLFYFNDVPVNEKEYQSKVSTILNEDLFKLITNPFAFNSLKWQEQRSVLTNIADTISDEEIAQGNKEYEKLLQELSENKTLEEYKKQISALVKKSKEELNLIPTRIDEVVRNTPEPIDFDTIQKEIKETENKITTIDSTIEDRSKSYEAVASEKEAQIKRKVEVANQLSNLEIEAQNQAENLVKKDNSIIDSLQIELKEKQDELKTAETASETLKNRLSSKKSELEGIEQKQSILREQWQKENQKELQYNENDFCCPTCKRVFEESDVEIKKEQLLANFNTTKNNILTEINKKGQSYGVEKENLSNEIKNLEDRVSKGNTLIESLKNDISDLNKKVNKENTLDKPQLNVKDSKNNILENNSIYQALKTEYTELTQKISSYQEPDNKDLKDQKTNLKTELDTLKSKLSVKEQIDSSNKRIEELKEQEKHLAQVVSNAEKTLFTIESFEKSKMEKLEEKVNSQFQYVQFKMFDTQINGGEVPCCEALVNGVPYSDVNTAGKINAGLDIINTLSNFYQVTAPIFIDNRESVIEIIATKSQVINLIVSKEDKILRIQ
jgi:DNA repair protein SbcC/Rad50